MSTVCLTNITDIGRDDCIGTSRVDINNNFTNLKNAICSVSKTQDDVEKRLRFLTPYSCILNFWGDIMLGGLNFDITGMGQFNMSSGQDLTGFALCNGNNGTPDLRDRFVVSSGGRYQQGELGPVFNSTASLQFSSVQLTVPQLPAHDHVVNDPTHAHTIADPTHNHDYHDVYNKDTWRGVERVGLPFIALGGGTKKFATEVKNPTSGASGTTGPAKAIVSLVNAKTNIDILDEGGDVTHENRPPYFALAYIMRVIL
jgi:hypothetical protein